jgi:hypothetical protein
MNALLELIVLQDENIALGFVLLFSAFFDVDLRELLQIVVVDESERPHHRLHGREDRVLNLHLELAEFGREHKPVRRRRQHHLDREDRLFIRRARALITIIVVAAASALKQDAISILIRFRRNGSAPTATSEASSTFEIWSSSCCVRVLLSDTSVSLSR